MNRTQRIAVLVLAVTPLFAACGGGGGGSAFGATFPDNRSEQLDPVLARMATAPAPRAPAVAVSLGGTPPELVAFDLESAEVRWRQPSASTSAPQIAGRLVFTLEAPSIVARDLETGAIVFREEAGSLPLVGAAGEGDLAVAVLSTGGGVGAQSRLIIARGGDVHDIIDLTFAVGLPAVRAGMLFIPWSNQNLSVLDGETGEELARVRISDEVIGHALVANGNVYTGQANLIRLTSATVRGTRDGAAWFGASVGELPGTPAFMRDAYAPPPSPQSAIHRVRLDFLPTGDGETVELNDDNLYFTFYRLVFALAPDTGTVKWVYEHDADIVGGSALPGGLIIADAAGTLRRLSAADGRVTWTASSGAPSVVTALRVGGFAAGGAATGEVQSLADQLSAATQNPDARLTPAQLFAVSQLAASSGADVTANLITLCDRRALPEQVRAAACTALGDRVEGREQLVAALERHARFLEGTTAPPVGALARAAARMEERAAVPHLISHLRDPATDLAAVALILAALGELGDESAAAPIGDFLRLYHAEEADDELTVALGAGIDALVSLEGPVARDLLEEIADDTMGIAPVRGKARDAVAAMDEAAAAAEAADTERQTPTEDEEAAAEADPPEEEQADVRPRTITAEIVGDVLAPVRRELTLCLSNGEGRPRTARVILHLGGEGSVETVSVTPAPVAACVEALIRAQTFPANERAVRQQVIYTIRR